MIRQSSAGPTLGTKVTGTGWHVFCTTFGWYPAWHLHVTGSQFGVPSQYSSPVTTPFPQTSKKRYYNNPRKIIVALVLLSRHCPFFAWVPNAQVQSVSSELTQGLSEKNPQIKNVTPNPTGVEVRGQQRDVAPTVEPIATSGASSFYQFYFALCMTVLLQW